MQTKNHISASCVIRNGIIYKNGQPVFQHEAADINDLLMAAYRHFQFQYPRYFKMDNLCKLGWLAAEVLLAGSFDKEKYRPEDTGIVLSNASASLDTDIRYYETTKAIASPAQFVYTLPNIVMGEISIRHGFKGENAFFISEDFDAGLIEQYAGILLGISTLQCCICGWAEVIGEKYSASLFLAEKDKSANSVNFTKDNLIKIYELQNG